MNRRELKKKIYSEFQRVPVPDVLENIRAQSVITRQTKSCEKKFNYRFAIGIGIAILLIIAVFPIYSIANFDDNVYATISLDMNPSVTIDINKDNKVIAANGLNDDGEEIIGNLKRKNVEKAIEMILDKANDKGYDISVVLYGIECDDIDHKLQLRENLHARTENYYMSRNIIGHPIWQNEISTDNLIEQAKDYGISIAKLAIINKVIERHPDYTIEELSQMSVKQLQGLLRK